MRNTVAYVMNEGLEYFDTYCFSVDVTGVNPAYRIGYSRINLRLWTEGQGGAVGMEMTDYVLLPTEEVRQFKKAWKRWNKWSS